MDRAYDIYVVTKGDTPVKAFTVKHECVAWLKKQFTNRYAIWVIRDNGQTADEIPWSVEGFLNNG